MKSRSRRVVGSIGYGLLVFGGTAVLGFVIAPLLGIASGRFPIDTEARAFFSLLTLKGVPYLVALSAASGVLYQMVSQRSVRARAALYVANVLFAWLIAAAIALAILG